MANISHFTQTVNGISTTYDIHDANAVPRSGGAVLNGAELARNTNTNELRLCGGTAFNQGASIILYGKDRSESYFKGRMRFNVSDGSNTKQMNLYPEGTWTWDGTACQITSDQRLKQQITEIDDKLLDAWEDVNLVQFKYNDAVDQKVKTKQDCIPDLLFSRLIQLVNLIMLIFQNMAYTAMKNIHKRQRKSRLNKQTEQK